MITSIDEFRLNERSTGNLIEFLHRMHAIEADYTGRSVDIELNPQGYSSVYLSKLVVPADMRESGVGSSFMRELVDLADEYGVILTVSPADSYGGTVSRLKPFYNRFGFYDNSGRKRDDRFMYEMIRMPRYKRVKK